MLLALAGMAFDQAHLHQAKHQLITLAESAANDAVTYGVNQDILRAGHGMSLDPDRVQTAVAQAMNWPDGSVALTAWHIDIISNTQVHVTVTGTVRAVFLRALPGFGDLTTITASADAVAR